MKHLPRGVVLGAFLVGIAAGPTLAQQMTPAEQRSLGAATEALVVSMSSTAYAMGACERYFPQHAAASAIRSISASLDSKILAVREGAQKVTGEFARGQNDASRLALDGSTCRARVASETLRMNTDLDKVMSLVSRIRSEQPDAAARP